MEFIVPLPPVPASRPRFNDKGFASSNTIGQGYELWRKQFEHWFKSWLEKTDEKLLGELLLMPDDSQRVIKANDRYRDDFLGYQMLIEFVCKRPKTAQYPFPLSKGSGDADNLAKAVIDGIFQSSALEGMPTDDKLIQRVRFVKRYSRLDSDEKPHIWVKIKQLTRQEPKLKGIEQYPPLGNKISFKVPLPPQTASRPRFNSRGKLTITYIGGKYAEWRKAFDEWFSQWLEDTGEELVGKLAFLAGKDPAPENMIKTTQTRYNRNFFGYAVRLMFVCERPKTVLRPFPIDRKQGDLDNLAKAVIDGIFQSTALKDLTMIDDSLIQDWDVAKRYTRLDSDEKPHILVQFAQITPNEIQDGGEK